jgi:hypothetical protein
MQNAADFYAAIRAGGSMDAKKSQRWLVALALLAFATHSVAHHSVAGQFDIKKKVSLSGVVSKVDWVNPHIYVHLDVKEASGKIVTWRLEGTPVAMARKAGLTKAMLTGNGETITVEAFPARDGTQHLGFMQKITYPDGRFYQFHAEPRELASAQ